jgi:transketolase
MKTVDIHIIKKAYKRLLQMHFESQVGHIGGNLSVLSIALLIFHEFLKSGNKCIFSKGHAAGALYIALWSVGKIGEDQLKTFHKDKTLLAGHPPNHGFKDIPFATGSLGHGFSLSAGIALAFKLKKKKSRVFCITSDGEWQEGSTWEAFIFACHQNLKQLTILVDHNNLQGFGSTSEIASMSPLWEKIKGFDVEIEIINGHDINAMRKSLNKSQKKLKIIFLKTIKGHGVSFMENKMESHYLPLSKKQYYQAINEIEKS